MWKNSLETRLGELHPVQDLVKVIFTTNAGSFFHEMASELPLTYGINHAGLSCEGLLSRSVVEHVEGDNTIPC